MDKLRFGELMYAAREASGLHSARAMADYLANYNIHYTEDAVRLWCNGKRVPDRDILIRVLGALAERGGIRSIDYSRQIMISAGYIDLTPDEQHTYIPQLVPLQWIENMPSQPYDELIGRDSFIQDVIEHLTSSVGKSIISISGLGGIGKTAAAYEVVQQVMPHGHFTKVAWGRTRSYDFLHNHSLQEDNVVYSGDALLRSYAIQLGLDGLLIHTGQAFTQAIGRAFRRGKYLLVLDNIETVEQAYTYANLLYPLITPTQNDTPTRILMTTRVALSDLPFVRNFVLGGLTYDHAMELIRVEAFNRGADTLLSSHTELTTRIYDVTEGMPLALKLLVSQYLLGIALDTELNQLQKALNKDEFYKYIYFSLWQALSIPAQQIMVAGAGFGGSARRDMLIQVSQLDEPSFIKAIPELVKTSLIDLIPNPIAQHQRYDMHAITRWFVNSPLRDMWLDSLSD